jgi:predicted nucleotide-binding protein
MVIKRKESATPVPEPPSVSSEKGIELIKKQIEKGEELLAKRPLNKDDYLAWENITQACLEKAFGLYSPNINKVLDIGKYGPIPMGASETVWEQRRVTNLKSKVSMLYSQIELLEMEIGLASQDIKNSTAIILLELSKRIFLVHGQNEGIKETTARFLEKLGLEPIILHEQPNKGRTIIEKFTDYSDVGFAVILLTADDTVIGSGPSLNNIRQEESRARQNVILELGYFLGKIGRQRVCVLYQEGVSIPSDYSGVLFIKLDDVGAWRMQLAKEIKAAGIDVDMNKAI